MIKKSIVGLVLMLFLVTNAWALTPVPDTGSPSERVCNPHAYTDLGNGIVKDNVTGLEWVKDGNFMVSRDPDFDQDFYYGDGAVTWQHALDYIALLNAEEFLGHDDWRLPSIKELSILVDAGRSGPSIDPVFSNTPNQYYWSSTSYADSAWMVYFYSGYGGAWTKDGSYCVRPVRGEPYGSSVPFVVNGDGTVTDPNTGLMWHECNAGQTWDGTGCAGSTATRTWAQAVAYVQELNNTNYLGYDDWRMPTTNELQSIMDYSVIDPTTKFPNMLPNCYWSSTTVAGYPDYVWIAEFWSGIMGHDVCDLTYVRAVRGGPCFPVGGDEWDLDGDGNVDKDDSKMLALRQKDEKTALKLQHTTEKAEMKAALGSSGDCDAEMDLDEDCDVDKDDSSLLKLRQKAEKTTLKEKHTAEKAAMKAAL